MIFFIKQLNDYNTITQKITFSRIYLKKYDKVEIRTLHSKLGFNYIYVPSYDAFLIKRKFHLN